MPNRNILKFRKPVRLVRVSTVLTYIKYMLHLMQAKSPQNGVVTPWGYIIGTFLLILNDTSLGLSKPRTKYTAKPHHNGVPRCPSTAAGYSQRGGRLEKPEKLQSGCRREPQAKALSNVKDRDNYPISRES